MRLRLPTEKGIGLARLYWLFGLAASPGVETEQTQEARTSIGGSSNEHHL